MSPNHRELNRREFLRTTALTGAALSGLAAGSLSQDAEQAKLPRRKLGRTDLEVSVLGYGSEFMNDQALVEHLIAEGINNIDTAVLYQGGNTERQLAPVLAEHGDDVVIATKLLRSIPDDSPKEAYLKNFEGSCERMEVDGVDILYLHDRRTAEAVNCPGAKAAVDELMAAGRVKHFGLSTHLGQPAVVQAGLDLGWFDVMLVAHSFIYPQTHVDALKAAAEAGVGIQIMKVFKALTPGQDWYPRATDEQRAILDEANLFQASIKWALSRDYVTAAVISIANYDEAAQDIAAARDYFAERDARALGTFRDMAYASVCRGCGSCDAACPRSVAVSDILRYRVYCEGYGQREGAAAHYRALPAEHTAAACTDCGTCETACPYGLPIRDELRRAHQLLA